ncbi:MAG: GxxExxY protein [Sedimentisphaerales bacterium]|nr:GxxExxY protein [Sedimentisphaerales bacterium]
MAESDLMHSEITREIIGAAMEVHRTLGSGFLESVYEEALAIEFNLRKVQYERQKNINVIYKGLLAKQFICDFLVDHKVLVELKAIKAITGVEEAQLLNYLKATGLELGLLINFGEQSLKYKRLVLQRRSKTAD